MNNRVKIEAIVACSSTDGAIGKYNTLPFRLPLDMARFKRITTGHAVVMGRKTAMSIPFALPNRTNYVVTHKDTTPYEGQIPVQSMQEVVNYELATKETATIFVIGGEEIYRMMMPYLTGLHITIVDQPIEEADAFWPEGEFRCFFPRQGTHPNHTPAFVEKQVDNGICTHYSHYLLEGSGGPPLLSIPLWKSAEVPYKVVNPESTETTVKEDPPPSINARIEKIEDYVHQLGKSVKSDIANLSVGFHGFESRVSAAVDEFETWLEHLASSGARESTKASDDVTSTPRHGSLGHVRKSRGHARYP